MSRYSRHILLPEIGSKGQEKINKAKVLVIGAGGLGCPVLQYLAAAGIGTLGIIDFDVVEESNLQRQILYGVSSLGKNKALAAKERLTDLNPLLIINAYQERLTTANALELFASYDIVVDGTDNFSTRYLVNDACVITNTPLVYGAIFKFEGQVAVFNYKNGPSYRCLFPKSPKEGSVPSCSEIGVLGVLPGIIGSMQANEVLKIVLSIGDVLSGKLLLYNALTANSNVLQIGKNEVVISETLAMAVNFKDFDYDFFCGITKQINVREIPALEAIEKSNVVFVDVREEHELPKIASLNPFYAPLSSIEDVLAEFDKSKTYVVFCQSGVRSKKAVAFLTANTITNCFSVKGGALAIAKSID